VGVFDIPGAFLQAEQKDITYVKISGDLTFFLVEMNPDVYSEYVVVEKGKEKLYQYMAHLAFLSKRLHVKIPLHA
jgi:hypothetical protein